MTDDNERSKALFELSVGYAHDIGAKLAADITKDGFHDLAEGLTLMCLTFTECHKENALRVAGIDRNGAIEMLQIAAQELTRCAQLLREGHGHG